MARRVAVPDRVLSLGVLDVVDYQDSYVHDRRVIASPGRIRPRSADEMTTLAFGALPTWLRRIIAAVHRHVLRLELRLPSAVPVPGWLRLRNRQDEAVYGVDGSLLAARLVVSVTTTTVQVSTLVRYARPAARVVWAGIGPAHRIIVRVVLNRGVIAESRHHAETTDS